MKAAGQSAALLALLGLGAADLVALNGWAVPSLIAENENAGARDRTTMFAATEARSPAPRATSTAIAAAAPERAPAPAPELAKAPAPTREAEPQPADVQPTRAYTLEFIKGTWWIGPLARRDLEHWLEGEHGSSQIEVAGHADASGPDQLNQSVSERRAEAVAEILVASGIATSRIEVRAYGESRPSEDGRDHDRRVELWLRGPR